MENRKRSSRMNCFEILLQDLIWIGNLQINTKDRSSSLSFLLWAPGRFGLVCNNLCSLSSLSQPIPFCSWWFWPGDPKALFEYSGGAPGLHTQQLGRISATEIQNIEQEIKSAYQHVAFAKGLLAISKTNIAQRRAAKTKFVQINFF